VARYSQYFFSLVALLVLSGSGAKAEAESILFGVDIFEDQLITIDSATGMGSTVGPLGFELVRGLDYDSSTDTLFGISSTVDLEAPPDAEPIPDDLIVIDRTTGAATMIGSLGFFSVRALAYDSSSDTLYGADTLTDQLITVDRDTGAAAAVGPLGFEFVRGLAYDSSTDTLFGVDTITDKLIVIDRITGAGTARGPLGFAIVRGLTYDPSTDTLYGVDTLTDELITIDPITGAGTAVGPLGFDSVYGVAAIPIPQIFGDVPPSYWAFSFIETLAVSGITAGCDNENYCPVSPVTRAQMAVFLERGIHGSSFSPPPASGEVFLDVSAGSFAAAYIENFFLDGITSGCGDNNYCPDAKVTRAQMAVFLLRAKHGENYSPPAGSGVFHDVLLSHWAVDWIEQLAEEGITAGCGNGNYCPEAVVTRDQMAVFLVRTFDL
jgi:hypothetical protein